MGEASAICEQWLAERAAVRERLAQAENNLRYAIENALEDLGELGRARGRDIMDEVISELDEIETLVPAETTEAPAGT